MTRRRSNLAAIVAALIAMVLAGSIDWIAPFAGFVGEAHAVIGRPATPGSVAGVARRTTRRVIRRSAIYVNTLPAACARVTVSGVVVWSCGGTYYQPYGGRYVVVYID